MVIGELKVFKTRFPELGFAKCGRNDWRVVATDTGATIGCHYASQIELLADLDRYAREYGVNP